MDFKFLEVESISADLLFPVYVAPFLNSGRAPDSG